MESCMTDRYEDMTLAERCDALVQARRDAVDDERIGTRQAPYPRDDPRFDAYLSARNEIRENAGKKRLR